MIMKVSASTTIQNVLDQFCLQFPYLKLEFYSKPHVNGQGSSVAEQIQHTTLLKEVNPNLNELEFVLSEDMTVADFENLMEQEFKLHVQVFRKSNAIWLQTSATDSWTLGKQNGKGQRSTVDYDIDPIDITDFDLE
jgi:hypothetical protein